MLSLGRKLKELRMKHGITQDKFGEILGYKTACMVSQYEKNYRPLPHHLLVKIKKEFDVSYEWLLEDQENEK